jgi:hypothetical protein
MMSVDAPETCWATHKRQVINLWNCCIWLVNLFELYDDARTCQRQREFRVSCLKPYSSMLRRLRMLAIIVIRTSGKILPTYEQSEAFLFRNEFSLVSVMPFPFYPKCFCIHIPSSSHFTCQTVQSVSSIPLFSSWLHSAMFPLFCAPYFMFIHHSVCRKWQWKNAVTVSLSVTVCVLSLQIVRESVSVVEQDGTSFWQRSAGVGVGPRDGQDVVLA